MELFKGRSLGDTIHKYNKGMPKDVLYRDAKQIANVLAFFHNKGIVHMNLKPNNILMSCADPASAALKPCGFGVVEHLKTKNSRGND